MIKFYIMKKILVPVDFSLPSYSVVKYAAALAKEAGAAIHLIHVNSQAVAPVEAPVAWNYLNGIREQNEKEIKEEIRLLKEQYEIEAGGEVRDGFTGDTISNVAKEVDADLIVIGIKSTRHNRATGSTALKIIRKTNIPVLVIPPAVKFTPVKNVILAIEFKEMITGNSLDFLFSAIKIFNASLRVVHVNKPSPGSEALEVAERMQLELVLSKVSHIYHLVENDNVDQGIYDFVQAHPAEWLVMIEHHHNFLERLFGEVHTRSVIFNSDLPLLILKNAKNG
jgi:nucleotide-binding universal stress UspA family protein